VAAAKRFMVEHVVERMTLNEVAAHVNLGRTGGCMGNGGG
jgi:hypothetical protein